MKRNYGALAFVAGLFVVLVPVYFGFSGEREVMEEKNYDLSELPVATFAAGCFWCSEADFEKTDGVVEVISGFTGGEEVDPGYALVSQGVTGHREGVQVYYDPKEVSYDQLLDVYWRHFDPSDDTGSFCDRGYQYTSGIFYHDDRQREIAEASKLELDGSGVFADPVVTPIEEFLNFYAAEDYHQDYYKENSLKYGYYRGSCGRDQFIEEVWGEGLKEAQHHESEDLKDRLTELQYEVTQNDATEKPFDNEYWDNSEEGIYVDIVSGEPLFSSVDKFVSGTGWPSFTRPLVPANIVELEDDKFFYTRTEVRSAGANSHLGHLFDDGPVADGGLRYCINSAALRFVPVDELEAQGYSELSELF